MINKFNIAVSFMKGYYTKKGKYEDNHIKPAKRSECTLP